MLYLVLLFVFGAALGSFLNVLIHRLPRGESIVFPPSHCPHCGKKIAAYDLIPILGYFILAGKCRACRAPISPRYPLVEFLAALALPLLWSANAGNILPFVFQVIFVLLLLAIAFIDLEQQVIPDKLTVPGIFIGLIYNFISGLAGAALGFILLYTIGWLGKLVFKKEAVGEGDYFLAAFIGAFLGWEKILLAVLLAYCLAALVILPLLILRRVKIGQTIPFGPALAAAGIIALFWGERILAWYR